VICMNKEMEPVVLEAGRLQSTGTCSLLRKASWPGEQLECRRLMTAQTWRQRWRRYLNLLPQQLTSPRGNQSGQAASQHHWHQPQQQLMKWHTKIQDSSEKKSTIAYTMILLVNFSRKDLKDRKPQAYCCITKLQDSACGCGCQLR